MSFVIETSGFTKYYGKTRGIENLNLTVNENDIFGFIGPNGSGKSTTIRTLLGLISATSGSAKIFGKDITKNRTEILSQIGYMPSEASFYNSMRVRDVISLSGKLRKADCSAEAEKLCERLELDTSKKIENLSLGNRKKVSIVCAFQHKPKLYILDEPTSGLDPLMQNEFFSIIKERQSEGATVFLSSHILSEIRKHCNHAAIIKDGKLIACDSIENLSKTSARRVNIHGTAEPPQIDGIADIVCGTDNVSFLYGGEMKLLIEWMSGINITDITITEPGLDEIFFHYYKDGGETNDSI